ncbi:TIGR02391 family protein [Geodermatophilus obscurus]|uniref:Conserved hypothetical protein CHP02391 domain-containing protein n=1 Tax=Geodermatophilus obscurus (strain ATCC 25078 / DSM 43160 / JCM 3152 / CCUG 61914 / KCC A-0152 / KCTC 9177 / NBRC 13315 / NRRL B-3577 / G-20) TaxID=526225 RepID=D2SBH3_GEOOG|nr:TIGR02391 family protein [Geodermatophilus obscurus]ADB76080.1 conserved hypothetical protein [Geodermatophilus obscurus DSM 43160]
MIRYQTPVKILRSDGEDETTTTEAKAFIGDQMYFPITTDVEEGDLVEYQLPNGKIRTVQLTKVAHNQSPFGGSRNLDHIAADFSVAVAPRPVTQAQVELPGLHPALPKDVIDLYAAGTYRQAVLEAFQAVETRVQTLTGRQDSGTPLMGAVFSAPLLDISRVQGRSAQDEQEGFKFLFMGSMLGIRNPRGHGSAVQDSPDEALEYLALASLLMRRLDLAEKRQQSPETP